MDEAREHGRPDDDVPGRLAPHLPRPTVPPALEARVERSLVAAGLLAPRRSARARRTPLLAALAAGLMCFAGGYGVGTARHRDAPPSAAAGAPMFALLLYAAPDERVSAGDVDEHRAWARRLARQGHRIYGEKLAPVELSVGPAAAESTAAPRGAGSLSGFFVVSARSEADALAIARSSPHYRRGGRVIVRRIERT